MRDLERDFLLASMFILVLSFQLALCSLEVHELKDAIFAHGALFQENT